MQASISKPDALFHSHKHPLCRILETVMLIIFTNSTAQIYTLLDKETHEKQNRWELRCMLKQLHNSDKETAFIKYLLLVT